MVFTDAQSSLVEPSVEACRPHAKVPPSNLRRTVEAIVWQSQNGAKWRAVPAELGPWWMMAQTFIRWPAWVSGIGCSRWQRPKGSGSASCSSTAPRFGARQGGGVSKKGDLEKIATTVKRLADLVVAMAQRLS